MPNRTVITPTVVRDRILVNRDDVWKIRGNPMIHTIEAVVPVSPQQVMVHVIRAVTPARRTRPRRFPFRLEFHLPAGLARAAGILAAVLLTISALLGAGMLTYSLYGDQITPVVKKVAGVATVIAVIALVAWLRSLFTGRCPGLHCNGCGKH